MERSESSGSTWFSTRSIVGTKWAGSAAKGACPSSTGLRNRFRNEAGVACLSGTSFGKLGEGYLRFSYANSAENIREGLRRVRECLQPA